jgi:hypothetical protein
MAVLEFATNQLEELDRTAVVRFACTSDTATADIA